MEIGSVGSELERYPDLQFLLQFLSEEEIQQAAACSEDLSVRLPLQMEEILTLYLYGLGSGHYYTQILPWLQNNRARRLIILEDRLSAIHHFLHQATRPPLLEDPQVSLRYISHPEQWESTIQELIQEYPCDRVEVLALASYETQNTFASLRLELLRKSTVAHALTTEILHYPKLLKNIIANVRQWHGSFLASKLSGSFKNIPAIICGAGPSLSAHFDQLRTLQDSALIIAGGSTITALSHHGIIPHLGLAWDPNPEEFERLKQSAAYQMPLIYGTRLEKEVFNTLNGPRGYLPSDTGGPYEKHCEHLLSLPLDNITQELGMEALSVTTIALALAVEMGCNPILFNGVDLSYSGWQRYAPGVCPQSVIDPAIAAQQTHASERLLQKEGIDGTPVWTLVKWVMESECIGAFAQKHPQTRFINTSGRGLGFPGIPSIPLKDVIEQEHWIPQDLSSLVHAQIEQAQLPPLEKQIREEEIALLQSLKRLHVLIEKCLLELQQLQENPLSPLPSPRLTLLVLDIEEESSFSALNPLIGSALDRLAQRAYPPLSNLSIEEERSIFLSQQTHKFKQWALVIQEELSLFESLK